MDWWIKDAKKLLEIIRSNDRDVEELFPHIDQDRENITLVVSLLCSADQQLRTIRRLGICVLLVLIVIAVNI
jgi:hypothetical protein